MSGALATPTSESNVIVLLARALWDTIGAPHSTHYPEVNVPRNAIACFPKTELASMKDAYLDACASKAEYLLILVVTAQESDGTNFMALMVPMDAETPAHPVLQ